MNSAFVFNQTEVCTCIYDMRMYACCFLRYDRFQDAFEHVSTIIDDIYKVCCTLLSSSKLADLPLWITKLYTCTCICICACRFCVFHAVSLCHI